MPKYLLIEKESIYIPGDERSRTNPGHGYPAHTQEVERTKLFDTEAELLAYLAQWSRSIKNPVIYEVTGEVKLETKTTLSLSK